MILLDQLSRLGQASLPAPVLKDLLESLGLLSSLGVRDLAQDQQGRLVHSLGEFGQQVDDPMIPAALLLGLGIDVAQSSPDAQVVLPGADNPFILGYVPRLCWVDCPVIHFQETHALSHLIS